MGGAANTLSVCMEDKIQLLYAQRQLQGNRREEGG